MEAIVIVIALREDDERPVPIGCAFVLFLQRDVDGIRRCCASDSLSK